MNDEIIDTAPSTTTPHPTIHEPVVQSNQPTTRRLVRAGALAGAIAAVCTTVVAAIASAADVSLEINATAIPIPAFAWWTLVGAALGVVLARLLRERRRFVVVTTVAVALSLIPAITAPDDTATKAVLVGAHLLAAAIIIPGSDLSQPANVTNASKRSACITVSTESAITSRLTRLARMPSCPMEMPSDTAMVLNSIG